MKIKYKYRSNYLPEFFALFTIVAILMECAILNNTIQVSSDTLRIMSILFPFVFIVIGAFVYGLFNNMPAAMVADENTLNIKVIFRKTVINYSDIKSISLDHEFREGEMRDEQNWYNEILKITDIHNKEYVYYKKIELNQYEIAMNPALLTEQFEKSEFSQLKAYIEKHIYINI